MSTQKPLPGQELQVVPEAQPPQPLVRIDPRALKVMLEDLKLLSSFVKEVLEPEVDWGKIPGIPQPMLWEPGADKLIAAYNCFSRPVVVKHEMDEGAGFILYIMRAELVGRSSGEVVADGIGVSSTREGKYGSRWVANPSEYGVDPTLDELRKRPNKRTGEVEWRIPNPDWGDLVHTLAQMAYKRAKVDAAQSLPSVSSTLRRLFQGLPPRAAPSPGPKPASSPAPEAPASEAAPPVNFSTFWAEMRALGLSTDQIYQALGVESLIKGWIEKGRTLAEAREIILKSVGGKNETDR